ncbi:MAG: SH3 domain-containing protein [Flavobacteriaceae bacterium]|nr:SH3 domain-containing protein [Flavobacteriaceae bacterium]
MKNVMYLFSTIVSIILLTACNSKSTEPNQQTSSKDLAVADRSSEETGTYLYVTAASGLSLREFNNLSSEKLAIMPYGTKIEVINKEDRATMTVAGIQGAMQEVSYNHKKGFAFSGYLSKFFPPEDDIRAVIYAEDLQKHFPKVSFTETTGGTASKPTNTETLLLPTQEWHEAFFIAQRLYDIPKSFAFPNPKGKDVQLIKNNKSTPSLWVSEMEVERNNNTLDKIMYRYAGEGYASNVTITQEGEFMKIELHTIAD